MRATIRLYVWAMLLVLLSLQSLALGIAPSAREFRYTADQTSSMKFYVIRNASSPVTLNYGFIGDLENYSNFRIPHYWFSTKADRVNLTLQREFDLRNVSSASLRFYTKYDIEYGWDFGYIELSANNGTTWVHLNTTGTTNYIDPFYQSYPQYAPAYYNLGRPALTGSVSDWSLETSDISPFAGKVILIRFRYVTDDSYSEHGWLVDDISLPEIGFFDDVESGNTGWSTDAWLHNTIYMNDSSNITPIYIDFVIPDNYTSSGSEQKVVVMELSGVDGDYNPTQTAVPYVVARFPPLVKIAPPPPTGTGSGRFSAYYAGEFTYFDRLMESSITNLIDTSDSNTPLMVVKIQLVSDARNIEISIVPLYSKPDELKDLISGIYSYFIINVKNIDYSSIKNAVLKVKVPVEWVLSNNASAQDVIVSRLLGGKVEDLGTSFMERSGDYYVYEAKTPGFSIFVVRIKSDVRPSLVLPLNQTYNKSISRMKPLTIVAGNESPEKVIDDMKRIVRGKTGASEAEVDQFFEDKVLVIRKAKPELEKPFMSRVILYVSIGLFVMVFAAFAVSMIRMRKTPKKARKKKEHRL